MRAFDIFGGWTVFVQLPGISFYKTKLMNALQNPENLSSSQVTSTTPASNGLAFDLPAIDPWPDPVDGAALLDSLADTLRRFLILPLWGPEALALWTLHTYAFHLRDVTA